MWQSGIFSMGYLSLPALKNLKKYSYKGVDESLVSRYLLTPYWNWFIKLFPLTIAPNTITLLGLCIVAFNVITLLYYDPLYLTEKDGAVGPPQWIYFTWAIGLFMYQSLDAVDGKQARRTGTAGPLGEMLNHGCDALNTTLEVVLAVHRTRFDQYPLL
ncbi:CDP-alcohol phosphatidyltransferase-domain-containing protein [Suillus spraguei]|nr:CDP-alcohol phosphatidyltransferase-domain-containing protein [Suillus spraguei]